jgi:hypothetical protein
MGGLGGRPTPLCRLSLGALFRRYSCPTATMGSTSQAIIEPRPSVGGLLRRGQSEYPESPGALATPGLFLGSGVFELKRRAEVKLSKIMHGNGFGVFAMDDRDSIATRVRRLVYGIALVPLMVWLLILRALGTTAPDSPDPGTPRMTRSPKRWW